MDHSFDFDMDEALKESAKLEWQTTETHILVRMASFLTEMEAEIINDIMRSNSSGGQLKKMTLS